MEAEEATMRAVELVSRWNPPPPAMARAIPPKVLKILMMVASRIRTRGLAGRDYRPPDRLRAIWEILERLRGEATKAVDPVDRMLPGAQIRQRAAESLTIKMADATKTMEMEKILATGGASFPTDQIAFSILAPKSHSPTLSSPWKAVGLPPIWTSQIVPMSLNSLTRQSKSGPIGTS
ncbi:MAG: hypothetical protein LBJ61_02790 [Deltaproteobacteria bacterium]|jgi:hypothetical protein|nr:hypothetical protein [Deltaproteobacteria bacterium]